MQSVSFIRRIYPGSETNAAWKSFLISRNEDSKKTRESIYIYIFNIRYCFVLLAIESPKVDPARNEVQLTRILGRKGNLIEKVSAYSTRKVEG